MAIINKTKKFRLRISTISHSGIRQPCDVEVRPYCMVLTQIDREGKKHEILLTEIQYFELKEEMNQIDDK